MMSESHAPLPKSVLFTGRGTTALWAALKCAECPGALTMLPVNICEIVVPTVLNLGLRPVFYDVDPVSGNATLETLRESHCDGVTSCIVVHNFGTPIEIDRIADWAHSENIFLIEDACNALGATWRGECVGSFGDASVFSFGRAKIVDVGLGGALYLHNSEIRDKVQLILDALPVVTEEHREADAHFQSVLRVLRQNPLTQKPSLYRPLYEEYFRFLLFMPDAALRDDIDEGLDGLAANLKMRREKAALWREHLNLPTLEHRERVEGDAYWRYTFLAPAEKRDLILEALRARGIPASKWFPPIDHLFEDFAKRIPYPGAYSFGRRCVNVFVDQTITESDIGTAAGIIRGVLEEE